MHIPRAGLIPSLVVAAAGTTDTGAVDPFADVAAVAHAHGLWLQTDGAYGGCFMLTETGRALLRGIDQSDSVVLDPHKGLFLPYGTGAVLVRDAKMVGRPAWPAGWPRRGRTPSSSSRPPSSRYGLLPQTRAWSLGPSKLRSSITQILAAH